MENQTYNVDLLKLEGMYVDNLSMYPAFIFLLIVYIFSMVSNIGLTVLICLERILHQPMYILLGNMSFNDALSITTVIPRLLFDILTPTSDRYITYNECFTQAFLGHWFAANFHTILMTMAFDRNVAICDPLRYTTIMNNYMLVKLCVFAWLMSIVFVAALLGLVVPLSRCRSEITNPWCDNASLVKLSCETTVVNNIYGLFYTAILFVSSMGIVAYTYIRITMVCLRSKSKSLNRKALHTCFTHLAVYLIMLFAGFIIVFLHRYPQWSNYRKLASVIFYVVPPALNPLIYGFQSKDIRKQVINILKSKKVSP
ncbi:olfactory receptor 4E1-like [Esox lucius]|uniref:olfactory receptor 4E1-like n=1 Tax=Esox lucius TaxID=8010 RepID=UPI001476E8B8|nr:olfactory receptor 4E1-like [Esox lucius]